MTEEGVDVLLAWRSASGPKPHAPTRRPGEGFSVDVTLVDTLLAGANPWPALDAVIDDRYQEGSTFSECIGELRALLAVLPDRCRDVLPPFDVADRVGTAFVDAAPSGPAGSLTGLPDAAYLAERIRETYRRGPPGALTLVAVAEPADRFSAMLRQLEVATLLGTAFTPAIVTADLGHTCFATLHDRSHDLSGPRAQVRRTLDRRGLAGRCWVWTLPEENHDIADMLRRVVK